MKLVSDARRVALRSYSMWATYLSIICLLLPEALYWFFMIDSNPRIWWGSGIALAIFGAVGRVIEQPDRRSWLRIIFLALAAVLLLGLWVKPVVAAPVSKDAFIAVAVPHVTQWEGTENKAYLDRIASPAVWTVCSGETRGVKAGDYYTDAQCAAMLGRALLEYRAALHKAFTPETIQHRLTPLRDTAYVSLAYNAGVYAISRSTAVRRLNAGNIKGGCQAIAWWNKAGQRVIRGLVNRRTVEVAMCMRGLA